MSGKPEDEKNGPVSDELDPRTQEERQGAIQQAMDYIAKEYLSKLSSYAAISFDVEDDETQKYTRIFPVTDFVYAKEEDFLQKAVTLLYTAYAVGAGVVVIISSNGKKTEYFLGVSQPGGSAAINDLYQSFSGAFSGNFVGSTRPEPLGNSALKEKIDTIFGPEKPSGTQPLPFLTAISGIPSLRLKDKHSVQSFVQGVEKLADSMRGSSYTLVLRADPVSKTEMAELRRGYEQAYTALSPFARTQATYNTAQSLGTQTSVTHTLTYQLSKGRTSGWSEQESTNESHSVGQSEGRNTNLAGGIAQAVEALAPLLIPNPIAAGVVTTAAQVVGVAVGGRNQGTNEQDQYGHGRTSGRQGGTSEQTSEGTSEGEQSGETRQETTGESIQYSVEDKTVQNLLKLIEENLERLKKCESFGVFASGVYIVSNSEAANARAAATFAALMRGDDSYTQQSYIHSWSPEDVDKGVNYERVRQSLRRLMHPRFQYWIDTQSIEVSPAMIVSGEELALQLCFPKQSLPGISVREMAGFGCNPPAGADRSCHLGCVQRFGEDWETVPVVLGRKSLTGHTFITGSTGSGKSNTVYWMLDQLTRDGDVHFMAIEPAKGEYKDAFGGREDVSVYGTNPQRSELLRINPFAFPIHEIRVQEHLDRLVEIFNVCWPMYAAMPAILKDACQRAYVSVGWDMADSINRVDPEGFPSFGDVLREIRTVVQESDYSSDNKGDYTGALVTRLRSLTTGIFGQVFTNDKDEAISGEALFDHNVIVDLSRVGSSETKSLIMGILVMQLQEHRMADAQGSDSDLRHVTVLEEAHNLLRRTSTEQSAEGANLAGKSVEMLSNAIAEMRTYGEGFIIADQAPGLLDMAAIRNTNTKIIMRLPDQSDRELVGKAAGLGDEQIVELAKLPQGVAAVYQNDWLEAVLCKVEHFADKKGLDYAGEPVFPAIQALNRYFTAQLSNQKFEALQAEEIETLRAWLKKKKPSVDTKQLFQKGLGEKLSDWEIGILGYDLFNGRELCKRLSRWDEETETIMPMVRAFVGECDLSDALAMALCVRICEMAAESVNEEIFSQKIEQFRFLVK